MAANQWKVAGHTAAALGWSGATISSSSQPPAISGLELLVVDNRAVDGWEGS
jgi:hypothetical protein